MVARVGAPLLLRAELCSLLGVDPTALPHPLGLNLGLVCTLGSCEHLSTSTGLNAAPGVELLGHTAFCVNSEGRPSDVSKSSLETRPPVCCLVSGSRAAGGRSWSAQMSSPRPRAVSRLLYEN